MSFLDTLETVLKEDERLIADDGSVIKSKAYDLGVVGDTKLLKILLGNSDTKTHFFKDVDGVIVFDSIKFGWTVTSREFLPDSYTKYKNKIGLIDHSERSIAQSKDVCLAWPYKDCVLEGGQTKEDQKRDEIFYNEILAPYEVNRLLYPKVLTGAKRYSAKGYEIITSFDKNENLVVKGNNLLVISSLLRLYEGMVKCIYIDVPYNTGNDSFGYNDKFNHSSWLTFMKNRLEIAKKLLQSDGTIAISVDNYELGYILVLLDEIFGKENRKNIITVRRASASGAKVINPGVVNVVEYVVLYSKDTRSWKPNRVFAAKEYDKRYNTYIKNISDDYNKWEFSTVLEAFATSVGIAKNKLKKHFGDNYNVELENFVISHADNVVRLAALDDKQISSETLEFKNKSKEKPNTIFYQKRDGFKDYYLLNGNAILFARDRLIEVDGYKTFSSPITDIWDDVLPNDLHNEGGVELKKGKKPEKLVARIIELCTEEGELVLDFFAGSGTTGAVAMKMNRQFILCEQMDYINETTVQRIVNTINGEKRGVSSDANWQGGGSFIYCELKQLNERYIDKVKASKSLEEILQLFEVLKQSGFTSQKVNPADIDTQATDFMDLSFENKQRLLIELVNKNMLYVNLCDIDDEEFGVTEEEKAFTNSFYGRC